MKNVAHQYEDKLLEFAYGELPQHEAAAVESHVRGCARCTQALEGITLVRRTMGQLPMEVAPEAGLSSLLSYAEQQARRNREAAPAPWWRRLPASRWVAALSSAGALVVVGVVAFRASDSYHPEAALAPAPAEAVAPQTRAEPTAAAPAVPAAPPPAAEAEPPGGGALEVKSLAQDKADALAYADDEASDSSNVGVGRSKVAKAKASPKAPPQKLAERAVKDALGPPETKAQKAELQRESLSKRAERADLEYGLKGALEDADAKKNEAPAKESVAAVSSPPQASPPPAPARGRDGLAVGGASTVAQSEERPADQPAAAGARAQVLEARRAAERRDLKAEVAASLKALEAGVSGAERLEVLRRLCDGLERLGDARAADAHCDQILMEYPTSAAATAIASRRKNVQRLEADEGKPAAKSRAKPAASDDALK